MSTTKQSTMDMDLSPLKGFHQVLTEDVLHFLQSCLEDVQSCYSDDRHDGEPKAVLHDLLALGDATSEESDIWFSAKDRFGEKAIRWMPWRETELRFTVVLTSKNELRIDARCWGTYDRAGRG